MGAHDTESGGEADVTPKVATQIRKIQDRVRQQREDPTSMLNEEVQEVDQRDDLVRLQDERVRDHEELVREREEEIRSVKDEITDREKQGPHLPSSKVLSVLWANGRECCCRGCGTDAGHDDSHSELRRRTKTRATGHLSTFEGRAGLGTSAHGRIQTTTEFRSRASFLRWWCESCCLSVQFGKAPPPQCPILRT